MRVLAQTCDAILATMLGEGLNLPKKVLGRVGRLVLATLLATDVTIVCGQKTNPSRAAEYDYNSLAINSIKDATQEAKKLPKIDQRIKFLLAASTLLAPFNRNDAIDLLDVALADLKEWSTASDAPISRRFLATDLRAKVLAQYSQLDEKKAAALLSQNKIDALDHDSKPFKTNSNWRRVLIERQKAVDEAVTLALSLLETNPERATELIVQSVQQGSVSLNIFQAFQKLRDTGNRSSLSKLGERMSRVLRSNFTLDFNSVTSASILASDQDLSPPARAGFVRFLFNSLETWVTLAEVEMPQGGLDPGYIDSMFVAFLLNVRPLVVQHTTMELGRFDFLMDRVTPQVSAKTRSLTSSVTIEEASDPKDQFADIAKEGDPQKRDMRLLRFIIGMLRKEVSEDQLSLLRDAVGAVKELNLKATLTDVIALKQVDIFVKAQDYINAVKASEAVGASELRAWTLLALSSAVANQDRFLAVTLVNSAEKWLERSPATPRTVEIALSAAALVAKEDPGRAVDILSFATRHANVISDSMGAPNNLAAAVSYEVSIGALKIMPARPPQTLMDIRIDPGIRILAKRDWFGLQKMTGSLKDLSFRLSFKLELAKAILEEPKVKSRLHQPAAAITPLNINRDSSQTSQMPAS